MATLGEKARLLSGLIHGEVARTGPFYATFDITNRCNLRCTACPHRSDVAKRRGSGNREVSDISFDLFEASCAQLKQMGARTLTLLGEGEPFLHPRILDIVSSAKRSGFYVTLLTNGTRLDETSIRSLIESRLDILKVSLWAASAEAWQAHHPGNSPETFGQIVQSLKLVASIKASGKSCLPRITMHQPIDVGNYEEVEAMVDLAHETGCDTLSFSPLKPLWGTLAASALGPEQEARLRASLETVRARLDSLSIGHNIDSTLLRYRIGEAVWEKSPCYMGWLHARIRVDGTILPCKPCNLLMGDLRVQPLRDIWNGPGYRAFRRKTLTRRGLASLHESCDCAFCCHVGDNLRTHRWFRWIAPFCVRRTAQTVETTPCSDT